MAERIIEMRSVLYDKLTNELKTPGDWSHIKSQIGMFRYALFSRVGRKRMNERVLQLHRFEP
jgi:aspartate aminotransferase